MAITDKLSAIADAIREKTNTSERMTLADMPGLISSITGGGTEQYVNFYDHDGSLLHQYPVSVFREMAALPYPPDSLPGCRCVGWNYDIETIKAMGTHVNVAAIYEQLDEEPEVHIAGEPEFVDGTKLYLHITRPVTIPFSFRQSMALGVTVHWGDGTDSLSDSGVNSNRTLNHAYEPGDYVMTFDIKEGCTLTLGQTSSSICVFGTNSYTQATAPIISSLVKAEIDLRDTVPGNYCFRYCYNLKEIIFGDGKPLVLPTYFAHSCSALEKVKLCQSITGIQTYAFQSCWMLREIEIPTSIVQLYQYCFSDCRRLHSIRIPGTVKTIDSYAFQNCYALYEVEIGYGTEVINTAVFNGCRSLRKISLPNSIKTIGSSAFTGCSFKEIILPKRVTTIGANAFQNCYPLKRVIIPEGVTTISSSAFINCQALDFVAFPKSLTAIQDSAFQSCYSIKNAVFGMAVKTIGTNAFQYNYGLEYIILPSSVESVGMNAFYGCRLLKNIVLPERVQVLTSVIPACELYSETLNGLYQKSVDGCSEVRDYAFDACRYLEKATIPEEVKTIGAYAFRNANKLEEIHLPSLLSSIGGNAFQYDYRLKKISFPYPVTAIGASSFDGCHGLEKIIIANMLKAINASAFTNCYGLKEVEVRTHETQFYGSCFANDYSLERIVFKDESGTMSFSGSCFANSGIREFTELPKRVVLPESSVFSSCYGLEKADLENCSLGTASATNSMFQNCHALAEITLPYYMNSIGSSMFMYCYSLEDAVKIPVEVMTINSQAFYDCRNLTGVEFLGCALTTIQSNAFYYCMRLREIRIPPHVTTMANAFNYCYNLEKVWMYPLTPPTGTTTIGTISSVYTIYVPKGSLAKYEAQFTAHKGHFEEFEYFLAEKSLLKKTVPLDSSRLEIKNVFAHTDFPEEQTFTLSFNYEGTNLTEIRDVQFDIEEGTIGFSFDRAEAFDYDILDEINFHIEADDLGIGCDFSVQLRYANSSQISEYVISLVGGYPFREINEDTYESTNQGLHSTYCLCMVSFTTLTGKLFIDCVGEGESGCDFGIVSNLDQVLQNNVNSDTGAAVKRNFSNAGNAYTETLEYDVGDLDEHFVYIKYRKDGSVNRGADSLKFTIRFE